MASNPTRKEPVCHICGESLAGDAYVLNYNGREVHYGCLITDRVWRRLRALEKEVAKRGRK